MRCCALRKACGFWALRLRSSHRSSRRRAVYGGSFNARPVRCCALRKACGFWALRRRSSHRSSRRRAVCRWNFPLPPAKAYSVAVASYAFRWRVEPSTWKGPNALDATAMRGKTFRWAKMHPVCKGSAVRIKHSHLQVAEFSSTCVGNRDPVGLWGWRGPCGGRIGDSSAGRKHSAARKKNSGAEGSTPWKVCVRRV